MNHRLTASMMRQLRLPHLLIIIAMVCVATIIAWPQPQPTLDDRLRNIPAIEGDAESDYERSMQDEPSAAVRTLTDGAIGEY